MSEAFPATAATADASRPACPGALGAGPVLAVKIPVVKILVEERRLRRSEPYTQIPNKRTKALSAGAPRALVRIIGFTSSPATLRQLNGKEGTVLAFDASESKYDVMINETSLVYRIKAKFLDPLDNALFENTKFPEPKRKPDDSKRSDRGTRVLIHDPDGSEFNDKYGNALQVTCDGGPRRFKVRLDGYDTALFFDGASVIPLSPERFDRVIDKALAKRVAETARLSASNRNSGDAATAETSSASQTAAETLYSPGDYLPG